MAGRGQDISMLEKMGRAGSWKGSALTKCIFRRVGERLWASQSPRSSVVLGREAETSPLSFCPARAKT
jgi:hypothetical protein